MHIRTGIEVVGSGALEGRAARPKRRPPVLWALVALASACAPSAPPLGPSRPGPGPTLRPEDAFSPTRAAPTSAARPAPAGPSAAPLEPPLPPPASADEPALPTPDHAPDVRRPTEWRARRSEGGLARHTGAEVRRLAEVRRVFGSAKVPFPPARLLLRAFKQEQELEVWAAGAPSGPLTRIATYAFCFASGGLGPKRVEGDSQVPEGFYVVDVYNPRTAYHLALGLSYPNASDRVLGDRRRLGSEIMIHGDCVSIGCIALGDERIEEVWVMASTQRFAGRSLPVHVLPARDIGALIRSGVKPEHHAFWRNLAEVDAAFEAHHELTTPRVDAAGRYLPR